MICFMPQDEDGCYSENGVPRLSFAAKICMQQERMSRPLHALPEVTVFWFVRRGRLRMLLGGRRLYAEKGDILVIHAGAVVDAIGEGAQEAEVVSVGVHGLQLRGLPPHTVIEGHEVMRLPAGEYTGELETLLEIILRQVKERPPHAAMVCTSVLSVMVLRMQQLLENQKNEPQPAAAGLADDLRAFLDNHYTEDITLGRLADRFYISPYYAAHVFKEEVGYSIIQYVGRRRIGEAQTMLVMTNASITQIADRVGYDNPNYFSTAFTKLVGISPQRYRQTMWERE